MGEYHTVTVGKTLSYSGYLDFAKLWRLVRTFMEDRGYGYYEQEHNEVIHERGKDIFLNIDLDRELSDYVRTRIVVNCIVKGLTDVQVERDGRKQILNDGKVTLSFDAFVITDYEGRFTGKGTLFFIRSILEKFVYERQIKKFKNAAEQDLDRLIKEVRSYLNLHSA